MQRGRVCGWGRGRKGNSDGAFIRNGALIPLIFFLYGRPSFPPHKHIHSLLLVFFFCFFLNYFIASRCGRLDRIASREILLHCVFVS